MAKIAVEDGLHQISSYLEKVGYNTEDFYKSTKSNSSYFNKFDAIIAHNIDSTLLNIKDELTDSSGINSNILNMHDPSSSDSAINSGILNENNIGIEEAFTSKPVIYAKGKSLENIKNELEEVLKH